MELADIWGVLVTLGLCAMVVGVVQWVSNRALVDDLEFHTRARNIREKHRNKRLQRAATQTTPRVCTPLVSSGDVCRKRSVDDFKRGVRAWRRRRKFSKILLKAEFRHITKKGAAKK